MQRAERFAAALGAVAAGTLIVGLGWAGQKRPDMTLPKGAAHSRPQTPPAIQLSEAGTVHFSAPAPAVLITGSTRCDENGNIYVQYSASLWPSPESPVPGGVNMPLTRVSPEAKSTTEFQVPAPEGYPYRDEHGFYVAPRGEVYGLIEAHRHPPDYKEDPNWPDSFVAKYKGDGSVDSLMKLGLPQDVHLVPSRVGVFGDGTIIVTGFEVAGPRHIPSSAFTAVFDRVGAYVGPITLNDDVRPGPSQEGAAARAAEASPAEAGKEGDSEAGEKVEMAFTQAVGEGLMVGSRDGNIYLIRATSPARVYVISPGGSVTRQFRINPPGSGLVPIQASYGGQGDLLVQFSEPPTQGVGQFADIFALVDPESGDLVQVLAAPPSTAGAIACLSPQREFLFLRSSKDQHLEVAKFVSR